MGRSHTLFDGTRAGGGKSLPQVPVSLLDRLVLEMLRDLGLVEEFDLDPGVLKRFLHRVDVAMSLHGNSYHNRFHSFDVAQSCFVLAHGMGAARLMGPVEHLALMAAALCHDLEHPGYNNAYAVHPPPPPLSRQRPRGCLALDL